MRQPLILKLAFMLFAQFCLRHALVELLTWKLFAYGKIFAHEKIKIRRKSLIRKEKEKNGPKQEIKKEYHSVD